ncbi:MAG: hypothetical protein F4Y04_06010 [Chloroflexi bacterium]|nr:hypothetical protein [Chloroflexota bacterium]
MALRDVIEEVRREIAVAGTSINEADAKAALITPILSELGWRGLRRIRSEYAVDQGRYRLDYALIGSGTKPDALIEAKAPREDLDGHVAQVLNYAFHEGVDICVLTNGVVWWLYLPREKGNPAERRFAALDLQNDDATEIAETLGSCLQYETLTSGSGEKRAKELLAALRLEQQIRNEIPRAWQRLLDGPNEMLIELVQEEIQEVVGTRPGDEQVRAELRNLFEYQRPPVGAEPLRLNRQPASVAREPASSPVPVTRGRKSPNKKVSVFHLWGQVSEVRYQYQVLQEVADAMYDRHHDDFERVLQLSRFQRGREGLIRPHQIGGSSFFVETNLDFFGMKQTCERLLEAFGYRPGDLEIVTED